MKAAILADIHANLPALEAVREDFSQEGVKAVWNLGDAVGYGAEPFACLQLLADLDAVFIAGNHEQAACDLAAANGFNTTAAHAIRWTRDSLTPDTRKTLCKRWAIKRVVRPSCEYLPPSADLPLPRPSR